MSTRTRTTQRGARRKAFTLIEMMVVLGIAALVTAITVGGFNEMRNGNKRVSCQANLAQIYQSCRMYASDEGGKFPYYAPDCGTAGPVADGIGLWSLYTFPNSAFNAPAAPDTKPIERYIRSAKVLHCPSDLNPDHTSLLAPGGTAFNLSYLSYQACDDGVAKKEPGVLPNSGTATYQSSRTTTTTDATNPWQRQLLHLNGATFVSRPPADSTIVTWCPFHRGQRDMDNVLFYDGSVQLLPRQQANPNDNPLPTIASVPTLDYWRRKPKAPQ